MRELVFLDKLISSGAIYVLAAAIIVPFVYGLWTGRQESREADRRAYGRLTELFEIRPERYVVRSLSKPDSSVVGSVDVAGDSITTLVLSGPNEKNGSDAAFTGNGDKKGAAGECAQSL